MLWTYFVVPGAMMVVVAVIGVVGIGFGWFVLSFVEFFVVWLLNDCGWRVPHCRRNNGMRVQLRSIRRLASIFRANSARPVT